MASRLCASPNRTRSTSQSTLLTLMDGGSQVDVIGTTNYPDAIDSALGRSGIFDRVFNSLLPDLETREQIFWDYDKGMGG